MLVDGSFATIHTGTYGGSGQGDTGSTVLVPAGDVDLRGFAEPVATFTIAPPARA